MAKELPYFRFTASEWLNGDISLESNELKGLFIDIASYYWFKDCSITLALLKKRFKNDERLIDELLSLGILKHEKKSDYVQIHFLNEQFDVLSEQRKRRQEAGRKGGKQKSSNAKAKPKQSSSYKDNNKYNDKEKYKDVVNCYEKCLQHFPDTLHPKDEKTKNNWLETIDKLNRIDKLPFEFIEDVTRKTREDHFWSDNFLAMTKLRKKNPDGVPYVVVFYEKFIKNEEIKRNNQKGATPDELREVFKKHFG